MKTALLQLTIAINFLSVALCTPQNSEAHESNSFTLVDFGVTVDQHSPPRSTLSIDLTHKLVGFDDSLEAFDICKSKSQHESCVKSGNFTFGIPDKPIATGETWSIANVNFSVVGSENLRILGGDERVMRITGEMESKPPVTFYFSCERGLRLVVIPVGYHGVASAYWAEGNLGLFAGACVAEKGT